MALKSLNTLCKFPQHSSHFVRLFIVVAMALVPEKKCRWAKFTWFSQEDRVSIRICWKMLKRMLMANRILLSFFNLDYLTWIAIVVEMSFSTVDHCLFSSCNWKLVFLWKWHQAAAPLIVLEKTMTGDRVFGDRVFLRQWHQAAAPITMLEKTATGNLGFFLEAAAH